MSVVARRIEVPAQRRSVAGSAVIVMAASASSVVTGFGREVVAAHYYGTHAEMDAFLNASIIPTVLFGILTGALVSALLPTFSEYMSSGRRDEVARLGSTVINALLIVMSALTLMAWVFAPAFVPIVAHGFARAEQGLVIEMVRWLMPGVVATSIGGVCAALLNVNHRFLASASVTVAANAVAIACVIALHGELGIFALVLGSVLGLFAQLLVQVPSIVRLGLYRMVLDLRHPGLAKSWGLLLPVAVGSGAWQISLAFDRYFASTLSAGSTASLNYTTKLAFLPVPIIAGAIATVTFPVMAGQFASANHAGLRRSVASGLRMVTFIVVPCAAGLSALAYPIVQTLFERGAFDATATAACAAFIPFACVPLVAVSYNTVLGRAFNACRRVPLAVAGAIPAVIVNIVLSASLLPILGARGLLLANGIAGFSLLAYQLVVLARLLGGLEWRVLADSLGRTVLASLAMAGVLEALRGLGFSATHAPWSQVWHLIALLGTGAAVFALAARLLGVKELAIALGTVRRKIAGGAPVLARGDRDAGD